MRLSISIFCVCVCVIERDLWAACGATHPSRVIGAGVLASSPWPARRARTHANLACGRARVNTDVSITGAVIIGTITRAITGNATACKVRREQGCPRVCAVISMRHCEISFDSERSGYQATKCPVCRCNRVRSSCLAGRSWLRLNSGLSRRETQNKGIHPFSKHTTPWLTVHRHRAREVRQ